MADQPKVPDHGVGDMVRTVATNAGPTVYPRLQQHTRALMVYVLCRG
eukprot:COSAG02_NODE_4181_length_5656_cov_2.900846_2_plen_47_part_00